MSRPRLVHGLGKPELPVLSAGVVYKPGICRVAAGARRVESRGGTALAQGRVPPRDGEQQRYETIMLEIVGAR